MTRKDWWLGILIVVLALVLQTFVLARVNRTKPVTAKFWPLATSDLLPQSPH